jgi:hypothetical protein
LKADIVFMSPTYSSLHILRLTTRQPLLRGLFQACEAVSLASGVEN